MTWARLGGFAALLSCVWPCLANAADGGENVGARLRVQAAADCATRDDLAARVAVRSRRIHFVDEDGDFGIEIVLTGIRPNGVQGDLVILGRSGQASSRRLVTRSCAEAVDAMALIIAVTLDPMSVTGAPDRTGDSAGESSRPNPAAAETIAASTAPEAPIPSTRRFGVRMAAQTAWGSAPAVMPGPAIYAMAGIDRASMWSPALVLGAMHLWRSGLDEAGGTASFTLDAASLDLCALRLRLAGLETQACASALAGRLAASGSETYSPAAVARPFVTAGGAILLDANLGSWIELSVRAGAGWSLARDSYAFSPTTFYRVDALAITTSLGLGVRLP